MTDKLQAVIKCLFYVQLNKKNAATLSCRGIAARIYFILLRMKPHHT